MSGAINYIMSRICGQGSFDLPKRILQEVFKDDWLDREMPRSLEDKIFMSVIRPRVMRDIDMYYGEQILIDLHRAEFMNIGDMARIYRFGPHHTNNREIISAECVGFMPYGISSNFQASSSMSNLPMMSNELMNYGSQVMSSVSSIPTVATTRVDIVSFNTVRVTDRARFQTSYSLRAWVTNDSKLSNIPPQAYDKLLKLCLLAVKAYCYNEYIIAMGDNFLQRGQELGAFRDKILTWESAAEDYYTYKEEQWAVQGIFMNDDQHMGHLQMLLGMGM